MVSFFLIINKSDGKETAGVFKDSLEEYDGGYSWVFVRNRFGIAVESSGAYRPDILNPDCFFVDDESGCIIVSDSRIDYKHELAGKLGIKWSVAKKFVDNEFILLAYFKWGEACLSHLYGDFAFVIWDPRREEILCARDHFGCRPLYYIDQSGFLAVASQISAFRNLPGFKFEIREQYILDTVCSIVRTETLSAFNGISRLKPAHFLIHAKGQLSVQYRYWDLQLNETFGGLTLEDASDGLRHRIIEAVRQRSNTHGQIGVELSGGLDSSGIASVLTMLVDGKAEISAFTHSIFPEGIAQQMNQNSEIEYSTALIEKHSSIRQFQITGENAEGAYNALIKALCRLHKPINLHYAMNSDILYEVAANAGASIIFSGLGGDEGITSNGAGYFNELIREGQHSKLRDSIRIIASHQGRPFYLQLIKLYLNYYAPWVLDFYKKDWRKVAYRSTALQKGLARKYRMKQRFIDSNCYPHRAGVRGIQHFRIMYPNIPERIEATYLLAQEYGIEYRYPFLDVKLLEYFYSLPSDYKFRDGMGRYLYRKALKENLPEKIRMRTHKGGNTIPYVFDRVLKDEEKFREIIDEGRLKNQYHYVDYKKLHDMLDSFKKMGALKQQDYGLREFQSAMSVLILQKWQREGKMDIGIKC